MKANKIALVGDMHFGPRCDTDAIRSRVVLGQRAFVDSMIADLVSRGIGNVVFFGDIFTTRSAIGVEAIYQALDMFESLNRYGIVSHVICGNHDLMYDDVDTVSSLRIIKHLPGVNVYCDDITMVPMLGHNFYMVPWRVPAKIPSMESWLEKLAMDGDIGTNVICGHFDMMGMLMDAGQVSTRGVDPGRFAKAAGHVFSGHYHCRSTRKIGESTITYLGTPYQLSFAHVGTDCGYYILDSDMNVEFIENTISPRFTECDDVHLDNLPDMSNMFVRYFILNGRNFDDALARKKKLSNGAHPLYIRPIPYGGDNGSIDEVKRVDDDEARRLMCSDSITIAEMYMDKYPDELPRFSDGCDPKKKIIGLLNEIDGKTQKIL